MSDREHSPGAEEQFSRDHVRRVLRHSGIDDDEADRALEGVQFPIGLEALQRRLAGFGITRGSLTSDLGGSP